MIIKIKDLQYVIVGNTSLISWVPIGPTPRWGKRIQSSTNLYNLITKE